MSDLDGLGDEICNNVYADCLNGCCYDWGLPMVRKGGEFGEGEAHDLRWLKRKEEIEVMRRGCSVMAWR